MTDPNRHLAWGAEALWQQLEPLLPGLSVEVVARTDSTNSQLLDRARPVAGRPDEPVTTPGTLGTLEDGSATGRPGPHFGRRAGDTQPCLLVAEHQTQGRGRLGREWQSSAGDSLTFSLALALGPTSWGGLSLAVGVALAEALDPGGSRIGLKWPNDLWLLDGPGRGRKLGGVLIETVAIGTRRMAVIGVGLNVRPQSVTRELSQGFACLQELDAAITAPDVLHRIARPLVRAVLDFEQQGFEAAFGARFSRRDQLAGRPVATTAPGLSEGVADGVAADGALRLRVGPQVHLLSSGEVSVRPLPGAATGAG